MEMFENLLQSMVDHTSSVIYLKDLEGKYILINRQYEKLFSVKNHQVKGKTDFDLFPEDFARKFRSNDEEVLRYGKVLEIEEDAPHEDGPHTYISVKFPVRDSQGNIFGVGGISTDITARKRMEEELKGYQFNLEEKVNEKTRNLQEINEDLIAAKERMEFLEASMENAPDSAFFLDLEDSRFAYVNRMSCQSLGYSKEELLHMSVFDIDPEYQPALWPEFRKSLIKEKFLKFESRHRKKNGTVFPVEITTHLVNFRGKSYSIAFARDISDRKKFEEDLVSAKTAAEQANKAKSEFLSHMSHELRTPLNAVIGYAQLLKLNRERNLSPKQAESIDQIQTSGQHLLELINDVLDLTLIETGSLKIFKENVSASGIFEKLIPVVMTQADQRNIHIEIRKGDPDQDIVVADPTRLRQALLNLVTNAVKYNREGGVVILETEAAGGKIRIHVADNGPGISTEKQSRVFEPFERLGAERSGIEGTGIGLTITRKLAAMMDGTLQVKSTHGEGSRFTLELPAGLPAGRAHNPAALPVLEPIEVSVKKPSGKVILYVEDNASNVKLIRNFIEEHTDYQFVVSNNAEEGLRLARESRPSLILMDMNLPGMNGITAFEKLKEERETAGIPVIALSAVAMDQEIKKARELGFRDYIVKPVDLSYLASVIEKNVTM